MYGVIGVQGLGKKEGEILSVSLSRVSSRLARALSRVHRFVGDALVIGCGCRALLVHRHGFAD